MVRATGLGASSLSSNSRLAPAGWVYAAEDPQLGRRVAIKMLHRQGEGTSPLAVERLMREAQALARLSHPNVVTVHEVGAVGSEMFLVEELVRGPHLRAWLRADPRSHHEILRVFVAAGEGLQAAHESGIVHRDFKPANVIVGADGRVRVVDFGLACAAPADLVSRAGGAHADTAVSSEAARRVEETDREDPEGTQAAPGQPSAALDSPLTATGAVVGTPLYMAPEQHRGEATDARSDMFAFSVALYEALYGEHPFLGEALAELSQSSRGSVCIR